MSILPNHKSKFDKLFDDLFGIKFDALDLGVINTLANSCPAKLLPILAKSFDVDIDGLSEEAARELLQNAFEIHFYSGTHFSLKKALKTLFNDIKILEWFEYDAEPYHFKVKLEIKDTAIDDKLLQKSDEIIKRYKNARSVLDGFEIHMKTNLKAYFGSYMGGGEEINVFPFLVKNIDAKRGFFAHSSIKQDEIININLGLAYKKGESKWSILVF